MLKSSFELRVFRRTNENMAIAIELAEREPAKEYHILVNDKKIALVTHFIWDECQYCTYKENDEGFIELV